MAVKKPNGNIKCIYGIRAVGTDTVVYVGKSINFKARIESHRYSQKNAVLSEWMAGHEWEAVILEANPEDMNTAEKTWIKHFGKKRLFNMVDGGDQNWRHHARKPWMAGQNIHCPSDIMLTFLFNRNKKMYGRAKAAVSQAITGMDDKARVEFEVGVAMDFYHFGGGSIGEQIERWLSFTEPKILSALCAQ